MVEIRKLKRVTVEDIENMGFNGFKTDKIIEVHRSVEDDSLSFTMKERQLEKTYEKKWRQSQGSIDSFQSVIDQGFSLGAYLNEKLVGFVLLAYYKWNNSMWIENIRVAENQQGHGVGKALISAAVDTSKVKGTRVIGLEVQSANYPAIQFYKNCGFMVSGIDYSRYPQLNNDIEQVAIIMTKPFSYEELRSKCIG